MKGYIHSIESFGSVDGPGIRFIIFMKGCAMRCRYCHNPDTWGCPGAEEREAEDLIEQALRYKSYWGKKGGITISGGEPLLQMDFLLELCSVAKAKGIHIALDTSAQNFERTDAYLEKFNKLMEYVDLVLLDIKHIDEQKHQWLTGVSNKNALDCALYLSEINKPVWIRHVLVPGVNDQDEYLNGMQTFLSKLTNIERVEVLPYHTLGLFKWEELGLEYGLKNVQPPTPESMSKAEKILNLHLQTQSR
jgi:pyruvate formate lyase activating enzyme